MTTVETLTADVTQEIIHDQIKKLAETIYEQSNVRLKYVSIYWSDYYDGIDEIKIETTKR